MYLSMNYDRRRRIQGRVPRYTERITPGRMRREAIALRIDGNVAECQGHVCLASVTQRHHLSMLKVVRSDKKKWTYKVKRKDGCRAVPSLPFSLLPSLPPSLSSCSVFLTREITTYLVPCDSSNPSLLPSRWAST